MADEDRTFDPSRAQTNRGREQGLGVGQKELDLQRDPSGEQQALDPQRTEPWDGEGDGAKEADRGAGPRVSGSELGEGTPANLDVHQLGQDDNPEEDWGEPAGEGAMHGETHTRRPVRTEAERGQGAKTRQLNKDIISRRS
jgi:hypothetical protein